MIHNTTITIAIMKNPSGEDVNASALMRINGERFDYLTFPVEKRDFRLDPVSDASEVWQWWRRRYEWSR